MKTLSVVAATALSLSAPPAASGEPAGLSARLPVHKALALLHRDDETGGRFHAFAAQAGTGAFLEMTPAAP